MQMKSCTPIISHVSKRKQNKLESKGFKSYTVSYDYYKAVTRHMHLGTRASKARGGCTVDIQSMTNESTSLHQNKENTTKGRWLANPRLFLRKYRSECSLEVVYLAEAGLRFCAHSRVTL